ncbi:MAG: hypothetical protein ACYTAS_15720 [Planctomycetota bacterium]|jgi:hypothetical protein
MGDFTLKARWFDGQLNEVTTPETPGRYTFYVEAKPPADALHPPTAST